jgi:GH25 family lysozyme M1 (1,4-beta-N-acetylmuramidase)
MNSSTAKRGLMKTQPRRVTPRLAIPWKRPTARRKDLHLRPALDHLEGRALLSVCPTGPTLRGVDVSVFQGPIDWNTVAASGVGFAYARVSDGAKFVDPAFDGNYSGIKAAGLTRGAYQFFEPGEDPASQADLMIQKIGTLGSGDLPPALDVEVTDGQSATTIAAGIQTWVTVVQNATGRAPVIYAGPGFWNSSVGSSIFGGDPLWVANWGVTCPNVPSGWNNWVFWQFSDQGSVPGIGAAVDLDEFNGSLADLESFAGAQSAFSALTSPTIVYGTGTTVLSGHLAAGASVPPANETVSVTLNGVTQAAAFDGSGNFSTGFATGALGVAGSPYTIHFAYGGDGTFNGATGSVTLTVTKATLRVAADDPTKITREANPPFTASYGDFVNGETPATSGVTGGPALTTTATAGSPPGLYAITAGPGTLAAANYQFTFADGTLTVLSFAQAADNLVAQVDAGGLPGGTQDSLDSTLQAAIASFNRGDTTPGENQLRAFENRVRAQRGHEIDAALADSLIAYAQRIIDAIG